MSQLLEIALGVLTDIGGFIDIGDLVASTDTGARFGLGLAWVLVVGVLGIMVYAEMAGRVASVSGRAVFDLVRDRLGAGMGLVNLLASFFITLLTLAAEIGGVALSLQLVTSVNYLLFVPVIAVLVWVVCWRVKFETMDNLVGLLGLALVIVAVAVAVWRAHPTGAPCGTAPPTVLGGGLVLTTLDPVKLTEYAIVLSAAALPLTYLPVLIVANDATYLGDKVNSRLANAIATAYLVLLLAASLATIPLMIVSKAGGS